MNSIENHGGFLEIHSHINNDAVQIMENISTDILEWIQFCNIEPDKNDIKILNTYFENHKNIYLRWVENWWLPLLPELEKFRINFDDELICSLKNNKVTGLFIQYGPDKRYDLINFLVFKDTLEELFLDGNYKNIEPLINETDKLKKLGLFSAGINFDKIGENAIEEFSHYGSKIREWGGITKLNNLKHLWVKTNNTLEDLSFLPELKNLETLELWYCSKVKTFPGLSGLKKLNKIYAYDCNGLENVDELKKLGNVKVHVNGKKLPERYYSNYSPEE
jgi:hypothetical protein